MGQPQQSGERKMSKHDDRRITFDDVFMNQESLEQMILDSIHARDEDCHDEELEERE